VAIPVLGYSFQSLVPDRIAAGGSVLRVNQHRGEVTLTGSGARTHQCKGGTVVDEMTACAVWSAIVVSDDGCCVGVDVRPVSVVDVFENEDRITATSCNDPGRLVYRPCMGMLTLSNDFRAPGSSIGLSQRDCFRRR
jgi:hypothetical protein